MLPAAKADPVATALREGDEVAGSEVLDTPGHSPGHVSHWRAPDRVLVRGAWARSSRRWCASGTARLPG